MMKRCPTCNKTFTDPNLSYCIDDGTPLAPMPEEDDEVTQVDSHTSSAQAPPPYQPPSYTAPVGGPKRKTWPWVVGILSVLFLLLIGASVVAVLLIPRMVRRSEPVVASKPHDNNETNAKSDANNANSSSDTAANSNSNSDPIVNTPPPTDKDLVLTQLTNLEQEWTVANINADKRKLQQILADDYVGPDETGKMQGKAEYIDRIERDTSIQKWEFDDLHLVQRGDRATLTGKITFQIEDKEVVYDFVDRFVWRDGRWQATGSDITPTQ